MDHQLIRQQLPTLVSGHVPSNARGFKFVIFDGEPKVSTMGFHIDPKPFEGKVIASTDEAIVVKTGRTQFMVLDARCAPPQRRVAPRHAVRSCCAQ